MLDRNKHINNEPQLSKEAQEIISRGKIQWSKSKEEIWMEMEDKLEEPVVKYVRLRMLTLMAKYAQYAAAATVVLLIGFGATAAIYTKEFKTGIAQQTELTLPDNSKVNLHANSTISYKPLLWYFSRSTKLEGEAFFQVEKGEKFEVVSKQAKTVVLGTQFTVTARENEYKVDCKSGKVKVIEATQAHEAIITAGEKAELQTNHKFKVTSKAEEPTKLETQIEEVIEQVKNEAGKNEPNFEPKAEKALRKENVQAKEINKPAEQTETKHNVPTNIVEDAKNIVEEKPASKQERTQTQETKEEPKDNTETAKKRFRNSLNKKQLDILEDKTLSKEERKNAFMKSLSKEQRELLNEQNKEASQGENMENGRTRTGEEINDAQRNQYRQQIKNAPTNENGSGNGNGNINGSNNGGMEKGSQQGNKGN